MAARHTHRRLNYLTSSLTMLTHLDRNSVSNRCDTYSRSFETLLNSISNAEQASFIMAPEYIIDYYNVIERVDVWLHWKLEFGFQEISRLFLIALWPFVSTCQISSPDTTRYPLRKVRRCASSTAHFELHSAQHLKQRITEDVNC